MVGFTAEECYSFAPRGEVIKWADGKEWIKPLQEKVNGVGQRALLDAYSGPVEIALHKSRPNQTNAHYGAMTARQSFVDIYPKYSPARLVSVGARGNLRANQSSSMDTLMAETGFSGSSRTPLR